MPTTLPNLQNTAANANEVVLDKYNQSWTIADSLLAQTLDAINGLGSLNLSPIAVTTSYDPGAILPTFTVPPRPGEPIYPAVGVGSAPSPVLVDVTMQDPGAFPVEPDFSAFLTYMPPVAPTAAQPTVPSGILPTFDAITVPDQPTYSLPTAPTLFALNLPTTPVFNFTPFTGVAPTANLTLPADGALAYTDQAYSSSELTAMQAVISSMMQGQYGLPLAVEEALFDRARAREDRMSRKAIMEVVEDLASRNLIEPNGILAQRLREVRADNREKVAALNRDLAIERATQALEGVKFAVTQAMSLEQFLIDQNRQFNERMLRIAIWTREFSINRLNAQIAALNANVALFEIQARVWYQQLQGELAKLEVYKIQIEAQRLVGEINRDLIAQYEAQYHAVQIIAEIYRTNVEAAKVKGELNLQKIEAAKLPLQAYDIQVNAWAKLWDGYRTQVDAALGSVRAGEVLAQVYATRVGAVRAKGEVYAQEAQLKIASNGQKLDSFRTSLVGLDQQLRSQVASLDATTKQYEGRIEMYRADASLAVAESSSLDRIAQIKIEQERNRTDVELRKAEQLIQQMLKLGEILAEQLKARSANLSQLLAAVLSGVSVSAGINAGASVSTSASWGYSGDTVDWTSATPGL